MDPNLTEEEKKKLAEIVKRAASQAGAVIAERKAGEAIPLGTLALALVYMSKVLESLVRDMVLSVHDGTLKTTKET